MEYFGVNSPLYCISDADYKEKCIMLFGEIDPCLIIFFENKEKLTKEESKLLYDKYHCYWYFIKFEEPTKGVDVLCRENKCDIIHKTKRLSTVLNINNTAEKGCLNCLKYLHKNNCPWDKTACAHAAKYGELKCLKYLHENKCPWDDDACALAAIYGHLDCLKYLHENDCPWGYSTCMYAAKNGHLDCLAYLRDNGCFE